MSVAYLKNVYSVLWLEDISEAQVKNLLWKEEIADAAKGVKLVHGKSTMHFIVTGLQLEDKKYIH